MPAPFECEDRGVCNRFQGEPLRDAALPPQQPVRPTVQDKAIVDEAILRGATVGQVMDLLFDRALPRGDIGKPTYLMVPGVGTGRAPDRGLWSTGIPEARVPQWAETVPDRVLRQYSESLVAQ